MVDPFIWRMDQGISDYKGFNILTTYSCTKKLGSTKNKNIFQVLKLLERATPLWCLKARFTSSLEQPGDRDISRMKQAYLNHFFCEWLQLWECLGDTVLPQMLHGWNIYIYIYLHLPHKWPSYVAINIPAPLCSWVACSTLQSIPNSVPHVATSPAPL